MSSCDTLLFAHENACLIPIDGWEAVKTSICNKYNRFNKSSTDPLAAANRIEEPCFTRVYNSPKFKIPSNSTFFVMGSCFSREIERILEKNNLKMATKDFTLPLNLFNPDHTSLYTDLTTPGKEYRVRSVLNKYSPHTMLDELNRTLLGFEYMDNGLIEVVPNEWFDCQIKNLPNMSLESALFVRQQVEKTTKKIVESDVTILNLGFTETWFDATTGMVLNEAPFPFIIRSFPGRFKFFNSSCSQIVHSLTEIIQLVLAKTDNKMKFILTISPIPLGTTFTNMDVISANTFSKSVLRAAAQEVCDKFPCVDYFPCYEMIVTSPYHLTWKEDGLHPTDLAIEFCVQSLIQNFVQ
jgi:hypothetical protein